MILTKDKIEKCSKRYERISTPKLIIKHNIAKVGIDQLSSNKSELRRTVKWYHKLMFELICGTS